MVEVKKRCGVQVTLEQRSAKKVQVDINFNYFFLFCKPVYGSRPRGPKLI